MVAKQKQIIVVKKGSQWITAKLDDIVFFLSENKLAYAFDKEGKRHLMDYNLMELEAILTNRFFFRANRNHIVNAFYIKGFRPYERVKLLLELQDPYKDELIIISQAKAPQFRKWIHEL